MIVYHGTDKASALSIRHDGIQESAFGGGYFGRAFYVTDIWDVARRAYADFSEDGSDGVVMTFHLFADDTRVLDLRREDDWERYKATKLDRRLGDENLPQLMRNAAIDAIYDRSVDGWAVYRPSILTLLD